MVKLLLRRGARLSFDTGYEFTESKFAQIKIPGIWEWLLVSRHTEQPKLTETSTEQEGVTISNWSGITKAAVALKWEWRKDRMESMIEYAARRQVILLSLRGQVVKPLAI